MEDLVQDHQRYLAACARAAELRQNILILKAKIRELEASQAWLRQQLNQPAAARPVGQPARTLH